MSVYVSYTDEGESKDQKSGLFLIAGYVADELKWPDFAKRWSEEVILSQPAIPYLHMTEIRSESWRAKHGLTRAQGEKKVRKAVEVIAQTDFITAHFSHISEAAYLKALAVFHREDQKMAAKSRIDYLCFGIYALFLVKKLALEHPELRKIVFNISRRNTVSHHLQYSLHDAIQEMLEKTNPQTAPLFGDILPLNMSEHMPLQAADVLCWHLQRSYSMSNSEELETMKNIILLLNKGLYDLPIPDVALEKLASIYLENKKQEENNG